jgi:hypothetical protein
LKFRFHRLGLIRTRIFRRRGQKLLPNYYQEMDSEQARVENLEIGTESSLKQIK